MFDYTTVTAAGVPGHIDQVLAKADALVNGVVDSGTPSTYAAVMQPLDDINDMIQTVFGETAFLGYVHTDSSVRDAGNQGEERLQKWAVELVFRPDLYRAVKDFSETPEAAGLKGEQARLLKFWLRDLRRAGHELDEATRAEVKRLTERMVEVGIAFQRNIDEHKDHMVVSKDDLEGMPDSYIENLERGDNDSYQVGLSYPEVVPFMENSPRRDLREQLHRKFNSRAVEPNRPLLEEAVGIREQIAGMFGQASWAHHQLEEKMAKTPEAVRAFYAALVPGLTEGGQSELKAMEALLGSDGHQTPLQTFDRSYYETQLRKQEYGVDPMEVAAYFPLQQVLDGMLDLTADVFGVEYRKVDAPTWHPDVLTYAIHDRLSGELVAHFHMDLYPREGKFSHAAAFTLVTGRRLPDGSYQKPTSAIVANFTKPGSGRPSLLQHSEVETFFHEFGHILHQTLTTAEVSRFAGSSTEGDFVEAPSQIMENWTWRPEILRRFARHFQTGEPIPDRLVDQLVAAKNLNIALLTLRQASFGLLDMWLHDELPDKDLDQILQRATDVSLFPPQPGTFFPASFGHLLGGYDAGYYGYLWSEVYGDDMWSRFDLEGVDNPAVGMDYRRAILEKGGSVDGIDMLRGFLGREPNNQAFLKRLGIGTKSPS